MIMTENCPRNLKHLSQQQFCFKEEITILKRLDKANLGNLINAHINRMI